MDFNFEKAASHSLDQFHVAFFVGDNLTVVGPHMMMEEMQSSN